MEECHRQKLRISGITSQRKTHTLTGNNGLKWKACTKDKAYTEPNLKLYLNDAAYNAVKNDKELPYKSILVKENYGKDKEKLMAVTPMYKSEGFNPDAGDWFWAKYGNDGNAMASGKVFRP